MMNVKLPAALSLPIAETMQFVDAKSDVFMSEVIRRMIVRDQFFYDVVEKEGIIRLKAEDAT